MDRQESNLRVRLKLSWRLQSGCLRRLTPTKSQGTCFLCFRDIFESELISITVSKKKHENLQNKLFKILIHVTLIKSNRDGSKLTNAYQRCLCNDGFSSNAYTLHIDSGALFSSGGGAAEEDEDDGEAGGGADALRFMKTSKTMTTKTIATTTNPIIR